MQPQLSITSQTGSGHKEATKITLTLHRYFLESVLMQGDDDGLDAVFLRYLLNTEYEMQLETYVVPEIHLIQRHLISFSTREKSLTKRD